MEMKLKQLVESWVKLRQNSTCGIQVKVYYTYTFEKTGVQYETFLFEDYNDLIKSELYLSFLSNCEIGIFTDYIEYIGTRFQERYPFHIMVHERY